MKKISVIIPVYNAEKWIHETLDSLVVQTYPNVEIICVDDGSKDSSCAIVEAYREKYGNIRLIRQKNSGVCAARNTGIENASGDYIAFVDADDCVESDMYEKMIAKLEEDDSDIVFCEFVRFWPNGKIQHTVERSFDALVNNPQDIRAFLYSTHSEVIGDTLYTDDLHGCCWRSVFKKSIIEEYHICFPQGMKFAEDQVFMLNYLKCCNSISYLPNEFVHYRGSTKKWTYHNLYENNMLLLKHQIAAVRARNCYSECEKKQICGYLRCSTYFMIINEEFMFKSDVGIVMKEYYKDKTFSSLLTLYNFVQKYKVRPDPKRVILFILLKLHLWEVVKCFYPNKKY